MRRWFASTTQFLRALAYRFPAPPAIRSSADLLFRTTRNFARDDGSHMAAGVAYYGIFSIFPLALATIAAGEYFIAASPLQQDLITFLDRQLPGSGDSSFVRDNLEALREARSAFGAIAVIGMVWSGRAVFGAVRRVLNRAWKVTEPPHFLLDQVVQVGASAGAVVLFLTAAVAGSVGRTIVSQTDLLPPVPWAFIFGALSFFLTMGLLILAYRMVPDARVRWRDAVLPGVLAAVALEITKTIFSYYLSNVTRLDLVYGSIATIVVIMLFLYVASLILVWCAEFSSEIRRTDEAQMLNLRAELRPVPGGLASTSHRPSLHAAPDGEPTP